MWQRKESESFLACACIYTKFSIFPASIQKKAAAKCYSKKAEELAFIVEQLLCAGCCVWRKFCVAFGEAFSKAFLPTAFFMRVFWWGKQGSQGY